jgi:hypothetical protein
VHGLGDVGGAIKNASGLSGIAWRVRGRSTTPSTMISAT